MTDYYPPPRDLAPGSYVWAYLRDSGGPSQEQSVIQQESEIREYCDRHGLALVEVFKDFARSGGSVIGRDAFNELMDMSENEDTRPAALLLWNFARFARDLEDSSYYKALLRKRGLIIHSLTDPIPDGNMGRMVETLIDIANEEKRRQTSRDVKRGLKSLVSKGFAPGTPPRGYRAVKVNLGEHRNGDEHIVSRWEPDPELWDTIRSAWQMRASGKTYKEIHEATGRKVFKSYNYWASFFRNKSYLGYYGNIPDHHDPAITWETWEAVQKLREASPQFGKEGLPHHPRRVGNPSLLSGLAFCIECGSAMIHHSGHKNRRWRSYVCGKKDRLNATACLSRRIGADNAEQKILDAILTRVLTPDFLEEAIKATRAKFENTNDLDRQIEMATHHLDDLGRSIQRVLDMAESTGSQSAYDRLTQREAERTQIKLDIERLKSQRAAAEIEITPEALTLVLNVWRDRLQEARESGDVRKVKAWLTRFVCKIELGYNLARIYYTYPMIDILTDSSVATFGTSQRGGT